MPIDSPPASPRHVETTTAHVAPALGARTPGDTQALPPGHNIPGDSYSVASSSMGAAQLPMLASLHHLVQSPARFSQFDELLQPKVPFDPKELEQYRDQLLEGRMDVPTLEHLLRDERMHPGYWPRVDDDTSKHLRSICGMAHFQLGNRAPQEAQYQHFLDSWNAHVVPWRKADAGWNVIIKTPCRSEAWTMLHNILSLPDAPLPQRGYAKLHFAMREDTHLEDKRSHLHDALNLAQQIDRHEIKAQLIGEVHKAFNIVGHLEQPDASLPQRVYAKLHFAMREDIPLGEKRQHLEDGLNLAEQIDHPIKAQLIGRLHNASNRVDELEQIKNTPLAFRDKPDAR